MRVATLSLHPWLVVAFGTPIPWRPTAMGRATTTTRSRQRKEQEEMEEGRTRNKEQEQQ